MQKLKLNATKARQQFFNILSLAANGAEITITRQDMDADIILKRKDKHTSRKETEENMRLYKKTYGSISTSGYKPNEFELAKEEFAKNYQKTNEI